MRRLYCFLALGLLCSLSFAQGSEPVDEKVDTPEKALTVVEGWVQTARDWIVENGPGIAFKIVLFLLTLLVFKILARIGGKVVGKTMELSRLKTPDLLRNFFVNVTSKMIWFAGILIALDTVGVEIGPLLAGIGVMGFVVGFALQGTLSNFASGVMILLYRPYDVGDVVNAGGVTGKVTAMTPDNQMMVVPNNGIWGGVIQNVTAMDTRRVDLVIGVGYGDDLDKSQRVLLDEVKKHDLVFEDPAPVVEVSNLGASSVDFIVRPWCRTGDYWRVHNDLCKSIKQRLDAEGISIPFPQTDVHLFQESPAA